MGLLDTNTALQNATKCSTWHEIKASHASDGFAPLTVEDIKQMVILWAILLTALASTVFALEMALRYMTRSKGRLFRVEPCSRTERHCKTEDHKRAFVLFSADSGMIRLRKISEE